MCTFFHFYESNWLGFTWFLQVSYIVAIGIVDKLSGFCHSVRDPIDNKPDVAEFLLSSLQFLSSITGLVEVLSAGQDQDHTHLWKAYEVTDLVGTIEMLYGMLLHQGTPSRSGNSIPPKLPNSTLKVGSEAAKLLHRFVVTCYLPNYLLNGINTKLNIFSLFFNPLKVS